MDSERNVCTVVFIGTWVWDTCGCPVTGHTRRSTGVPWSHAPVDGKNRVILDFNKLVQSSHALRRFQRLERAFQIPHRFTSIARLFRSVRVQNSSRAYHELVRDRKRCGVITRLPRNTNNFTCVAGRTTIFLTLNLLLYAASVPPRLLYSPIPPRPPRQPFARRHSRRRRKAPA